ncbi:hypothetical protein HOLleu_44216 [Holothuria leucospilota]|uniref:Uncharacterized protein n=1 Tax=Holothuria leucospilota TaxID=206669 RepID=A0A9Q0Y8Z8_HOLLE|nr:hypothetical protein HOLleu_44216 [Holothuria leucospilota]
MLEVLCTQLHWQLSHPTRGQCWQACFVMESQPPKPSQMATSSLTEMELCFATSLTL